MVDYNSCLLNLFWTYSIYFSVQNFDFVNHFQNLAYNRNAHNYNLYTLVNKNHPVLLGNKNSWDLSHFNKLMYQKANKFYSFGGFFFSFIYACSNEMCSQVCYLLAVLLAKVKTWFVSTLFWDSRINSLCNPKARMTLAPVTVSPKWL